MIIKKVVTRVEKNFWERSSAILITLTLGAALAYVLFRFTFPILLPFLLAWLISLVLRPMSLRLSARLHLPHKLCAAVLLLTVVGLGAWGLCASIGSLVEQLGGLINRLIAEGGVLDAIDNAMEWLESLASRIGFSEHLMGGSGEMHGMMSDMLGNMLASVAAGLPEIAAALFSSLPTVFFVVVLTFLAGYYFCVDGDRIRRSVCALLPQRWQSLITRAREKGKTVVARYIKAYLLLLLLTFSMLFVGFWVLRIDYAFLIALIVAVLDLLPVLGVGTVLIPWSLILLVQRQFFVGFGLLILYLVVMLVRQIVEPRLVGKSLDMHPLLTLFATYAGFCLFGVLGMLAGPIVAMLIKQGIGLFRKSEP